MQRWVMVEAALAASFVLAEPALLLEFEIVALDPSTQLGQIDQALERNVSCQRGKPVAVRCGFALRPFDQRPRFGGGLGSPGVVTPFLTPRGTPALGALLAGPGEAGARVDYLTPRRTSGPGQGSTWPAAAMVAAQSGAIDRLRMPRARRADKLHRCRVMSTELLASISSCEYVGRWNFLLTSSMVSPARLRAPRNQVFVDRHFFSGHRALQKAGGAKSCCGSHCRSSQFPG
jgi:hypothetical protein